MFLVSKTRLSNASKPQHQSCVFGIKKHKKHSKTERTLLLCSVFDSFSCFWYQKHDFPTPARKLQHQSCVFDTKIIKNIPKRSKAVWFAPFWIVFNAFGIKNTSFQGQHGSRNTKVVLLVPKAYKTLQNGAKRSGSFRFG